MNKAMNTWDLTVASEGEKYNMDDLMADLETDPVYRADMDAAKAEALQYQMEHDSLPF